MYGTQVPTAAERRQSLLTQLVRDMLTAQKNHDSVQEQAAYLLERYEIAPKATT